MINIRIMMSYAFVFVFLLFALYKIVVFLGLTSETTDNKISYMFMYIGIGIFLVNYILLELEG